MMLRSRRRFSLAGSGRQGSGQGFVCGSIIGGLTEPNALTVFGIFPHID